MTLAAEKMTWDFRAPYPMLFQHLPKVLVARMSIIISLRKLGNVALSLPRHHLTNNWSLHTPRAEPMACRLKEAPRPDSTSFGVGWIILPFAICLTNI